MRSRAFTCKIFSSGVAKYASRHNMYAVSGVVPVPATPGSHLNAQR